MAICVSDSFFPEDPVATSSSFITSGPLSLAMREPFVQDKINGFVWESQMRDRGGDIMELDLGREFDVSSHKILLTKLIQ